MKSFQEFKILIVRVSKSTSIFGLILFLLALFSCGIKTKSSQNFGVSNSQRDTTGLKTKLDSCQYYLRISDYNNAKRIVEYFTKNLKCGQYLPLIIKYNIYTIYGLYYSYNDGFEISLYFFLSAVTISEKIGDPHLIANTYIQLAEYYRKIYRYGKGLKYLKKADSLLQKHPDNYLRGRLYNRYASLPKQNKEKYSFLALYYSSLCRDRFTEAGSYQELALIQKDEISQLYYLMKAQRTWNLANNKLEEMCDVSKIAKFYLVNKEYELTRLYLDTLGTFLRKNPHNELSLFYSQLKNEYFTAIKNLDSANFYNEEIKHYAILFCKKIFYGALDNIETKYENEKYLNQLASHNYYLAYEKRRVQLLIATGFMGLIFIFLLLFFFIRTRKEKRKIKIENDEISIHLAEITNDLAEKETLLLELNHRVKNNMATLISILEIQTDEVNNDEFKRVLQDFNSRIYGVTKIYDLLKAVQSQSEINLGDYLSTLCEYFVENKIFTREFTINSIFVTPVIITLPIAIPIGMIIQEFIMNSCKYAQPSMNDELHITLKGYIALRICELDYVDNGIQVGSSNGSANSGKLGTYIVNSLTKQIKGNLTMEYNPGFKAKIKFLVNPKYN